MILCDIGNTSFDFLIEQKHHKLLFSEPLPFLTSPIYYISVNKSATQKLLNTYPNAVNIEDFFEFKTSYIGLGVDRKVACYGCIDAIVVDAGSAITVDIINNKIHKGGLILPGLKKFHKIYGQISAKLNFDFNLKQNLDKIPQNTKDAISYSLLKATILPIKELAQDKSLIFTGGDGEFLSSFFSNALFKEELIFDNMKRILRANNCIA